MSLRKLGKESSAFVEFVIGLVQRSVAYLWALLMFALRFRSIALWDELCAFSMEMFVRPWRFPSCSGASSSLRFLDSGLL